MGRRPLFFLILSVVFLLLAGAAVTAQLGAASSCPDLVTRALEAVNTLCTGQDRNSACYGNTLVEAQFTDGASDVRFSQEGDRASLGLIRSITTSPLNDALTEWGVSLLNVQANLPGALPGQNALFMLVGGAEIESAVEPETAFTPVNAVPVLAASDAAALEAPDVGAAVVFQVTAGQAIMADARSGDGAFVRVTLGDQFGWIASASLPADGSLDALPVYTPGQSFAPMQAFYLRTGIGGAQCAEAPSALIVQGPENYTVDINANGANISLGSSIILETLPIDESKDGGKYQAGVGGLLRITVIDGQATITSEDGSVTTIPEGYQSSVCLTDNQNLGVDGQANDQTVTYLCGGWTAPEQIPEEFRNQFSLIDDFPLNYLLDILTPTPTVRAPEPPAPTATPTATIEPTAQPTSVPPTAVPPTAVPPTDIPPTQVTGADLQFTLVADLIQGGGGEGSARGIRFAGLGGGQPWSLYLDVTVLNNGPETAANVRLSDFFPEGVEGYLNPSTGEIIFDQESGSYVWIVGDLAAGASATLSGDALIFVACSATVSQTLTVTSDTPDPFPVSATYSATAECDGLELLADASLTWIGGGASLLPRFPGAGWYQSGMWAFDLTLTLINHGDQAAEAIFVSDIFPEGVMFTGATVSAGDYYDGEGWAIESLGAGENATLIGSGETYLLCGDWVYGYPSADSDTYPTAYTSYSANAYCGEPDQINIQASGSLYPGGEAFLGPRFAGAGWFQPNPEWWYLNVALTVTNNSATDATGVIVSNIFPAEVTMLSSGSSGFDAENNQWIIGSLAAGETVYFWGSGDAWLSCDDTLSATVSVNSNEVTGSSAFYSDTADCGGPPLTPFVEPPPVATEPQPEVTETALPPMLPEVTAEPQPEATIELLPESTAELQPEATLELLAEETTEPQPEATVEATEPPAP